LDPFEGKNKNDFSDYLYEKSKEIEPKNQPPPKFVSIKWLAGITNPYNYILYTFSHVNTSMI